MANYNCAVITNYFKVKDEAYFRKVMSMVYGEDEILLFEECPGVFGFGCYGEISGLCTTGICDDMDEGNYDDFLDELQKCVADDDAIIIYEAGNEKLRYIVGMATVITKDSVKYINIRTEATKVAQNLLKNDNWSTLSEY